MRNISIGIMIGTLICTAILAFYPLPEVDQACEYCKECWWFEVAEGGE
tara:strand:- start:1053 stop:1196 length:144 start_codon:yes stop_codon:yes gene_type:complete